MFNSSDWLPRMNDPGEKNDDQAALEKVKALKMQKERSRQLALAAIQTAEDNGGRDLLVLDMREHTTLFDYFVIATGTSRRQLHAMSEEIDHKLEDDLHDKRMSIEGYDASRWIVLDYGTVVVHLFDDEMRGYYSLETLWADAQPVDLTDVLEDSSKMAPAVLDEA
jgi:ribosome-associated protein